MHIKKLIILLIFNIIAVQSNEQSIVLSPKNIKHILKCKGLSTFGQITKIDQKLGGKDFNYHTFILELDKILSDFNKDLPVPFSEHSINVLKVKLIDYLWQETQSS